MRLTRTSDLWLMPFYPTPGRDDGYDIIDFFGVDSRLGSMGEFVEFIRTARDRGKRVIADLVVNHTSDQHPWFVNARSSRDSQYRDWYVWRDEPPEDGPKGVVFPDQETSPWEYDEKSGQYYLHRFYKHQPDLNVANPAVRDEITRVMGLWLELGLSGFRVDAVPFLLETGGSVDAGDLPDPHDYLADLRAFLSRRQGEGVLLGEVNLPLSQVPARDSPQWTRNEVRYRRWCQATSDRTRSTCGTSVGIRTRCCRGSGF